MSGKSDLGWDSRPATQLSVRWTTSTLSLYNSQIGDFYNFFHPAALLSSLHSCVTWPLDPNLS